MSPASAPSGKQADTATTGSASSATAPRTAASDSSGTPLNVVLGVCGGIAAYKACHVVRLLTESGARVRVVPTQSALQFVGAPTWEALSGQPVSTTVFDAVPEVQHVNIGQHADLMIVAPATADTIARLAQGRTDDLLTATALVATCPVVVFPAMHTEMWLNPATQDNVSTLRRRGITVIDPAHGRLTGKDSGPGRLPEPAQIVALALTVAERGAAFPRDLAGAEVLITAGGTHENIDPVRYVGNRSSGKQGFALAEVAAARGAHVTVVAGSTAELPVPLGAHVVRVESAREMKAAVQEYEAQADYIICAAAVADFRPEKERDWKMKKSSDGSHESGLKTLTMVENPDILKSVVTARAEREEAGTGSKHSIIVGFAAETGDPEHTPLEHAEAKLARKGCELLVCNDVGGGKVFGRDVNQGWVLAADGEVTDVPATSKYGMADAVWEAIAGWRRRADGDSFTNTDSLV